MTQIDNSINDMGYSQNMVSRSLSLTHDQELLATLTEKNCKKF